MAASNRSIPVVVPIRQPKKEDIHTVAETFLREYLAMTGSQHEPVQLSSVAPCTARHLSQSQTTATKFVKEQLKQRQIDRVKQTEAVRHETDATHKVILARRSGNITSYFYGWKAQRPLFTHAKHLAQVVDPATSEGLARSLRETGVEVTASPAPEMRRGSF